MLFMYSLTTKKCCQAKKYFQFSSTYLKCNSKGKIQQIVHESYTNLAMTYLSHILVDLRRMEWFPYLSLALHFVQLCHTRLRNVEQGKRKMAVSSSHNTLVRFITCRYRKFHEESLRLAAPPFRYGGEGASAQPRFSLDYSCG